MVVNPLEVIVACTLERDAERVDQRRKRFSTPVSVLEGSSGTFLVKFLPCFWTKLFLTGARAAEL